MKNKVTVNHSDDDRGPYTGDLFASSTGDIFILSIVEASGNRYVAIGLADGNRWRSPNEDISYAIGGLTPLGNKFSLTISR